MNAIVDIYTIAAKLKEKGWNARARENTAKAGEYFLHIDEDLFYFMTRPVTLITHHISGELTLENPIVLKELEKFSKDLEEFCIDHSLKVIDEDGSEYIHTFGYV
jgi:hypothetical protein